MRVGIAGLGLIGGSLAMALRARHEVHGFDVDREARDAAARAGLRVVDSLEALLPADALVIATPLAAVLPTLAALAPHAGPAVLVDVSSVRGPVEAFVRESSSGARVVGMHPMAGRAGRGFAAADPALLAGRPFLVVPTTQADAAAMAVTGELARDAGGVVTVCSAAEHDRIVAFLSALPLALAAALAVAAEEGLEDGLVNLGGPGFRDTTRLAGTPVDLGEAILAANAAHVVAALAALRGVLDDIERAVAERDVVGLRAVLERARSIRTRLD